MSEGDRKTEREPTTRSRDGSVHSVVVDGAPSHLETQTRDGNGPQAAKEEPGAKSAAGQDDPKKKQVNTKFKKPTIPATNLLAMKRDNADIAGTWLLDPTMDIPDSLLPPLDSQNSTGPRPTLFLKTEAGVIADIWLTGQPATVRPVIIRVLAGMGQYTPPSRHNGQGIGGHVAAVMIHALGGHTAQIEISSPSSSPSDYLWPDVTLLLPVDFCGKFTISAKNILLSQALSHFVTQFSDTNNASVWFMGDWIKSNFTGGDQWTGSSVTIKGHTVRIGISEVDDWIQASTAGYFHATLTPELRSHLTSK